MTSRITPLVALSAVGFVLMFPACGADSAGPGPGPVASVIVSVIVSPADATIPFGTATQFDATVKDETGNELTDRTVTWSSSDTDIVTVDPAGLVTGVGPGSTTITAAADGVTGVAEITITPVAFASVSVATFRTSGLTTAGVA